MFKKLAASARSGQVNLALFVPLLLNTLAVQVLISITRVTTSYRAVELDLPVLWIGVISASFAILPLGLAVPVGHPEAEDADPNAEQQDRRGASQHNRDPETRAASRVGWWLVVHRVFPAFPSGSMAYDQA